jgi:gamma-glutamylcyclotransferase (GGCT)/AIG2-like uncharacterized protein YtfP
MRLVHGTAASEQDTGRGRDRTQARVKHMPLYFAYGSNLDVPQMQQRCAEHVRVVAPGCLRGYALAFTAYSSSWAGGVADVVLAPQQEVWGLVYDLSIEALLHLDIYEGYPHLYTRFQGAIAVPQGVLSDVWIYAVVNKQAFISPSEVYLRVLQRAARCFDFPEAYRAFLDSIATR